MDNHLIHRNYLFEVKSESVNTKRNLIEELKFSFVEIQLEYIFIEQLLKKFKVQRG